MKAEHYTPVDRARFDEMLRDARRVERHENLTTFEMCWILDLRYPRADICAVMNIVEHEKGWRP